MTAIAYQSPIEGGGGTLSNFSGKVIEIEDASLTLSFEHNGCLLLFTNPGAIAVTCPDGLPLGWNTGWKRAAAAGQITFASASATIENADGHTKSGGAKSIGSLIVFEADIFTLGGQTAA